MDKTSIYKVELTIQETSELRNALRMYNKRLCEWMQEDMDKCDYAGAAMFERRILNTVNVFGKFCKEG